MNVLWKICSELSYSSFFCIYCPNHWVNVVCMCTCWDACLCMKLSLYIYIYIYKYRCFYYNQYKNYRGNYLIDLVLWTHERLVKPAGVRIVYCSVDARENVIWSSCQIKMVCSYSIPCHVSWGCFYISIPFVSYMHPIIRCLYEQDYCHRALHIMQNQI